MDDPAWSEPDPIQDGFAEDNRASNGTLPHEQPADDGHEEQESAHSDGQEVVDSEGQEVVEEDGQEAGPTGDEDEAEGREGWAREDYGTSGSAGEDQIGPLDFQRPQSRLSETATVPRSTSRLSWADEEGGGRRYLADDGASSLSPP